MIELDDPRTKAEIFGEQMMNRASLTITSLQPVDTNGVVYELTCFVCTRRWVGTYDELIHFSVGTHKHDPLAHLEWFLTHYQGWPEGMVELLTALRLALYESGTLTMDRFVELSQRLTGVQAD